jgi:3-hydroxyisobutyrate dehydrogenase-like beta-hydroxyacid dehydrogenase
MRVAVLGTGIMGAPMARNTAGAAGLRLGALAAVGEQLRRASEAGHGDKDMAATIHASRPA